MPPRFDEQELIRSMVQTLRQRPAEWLTFNKLATLIAIPECNADFWAGIAEYRNDLFVIDRDKRLKLRTPVVEQIALQGSANWQVPTRSELSSADDLSNQRVPTNHNGTGGECYCNLPYPQILSDLKTGSVPAEALVNRCCWTAICTVRGQNFSAITSEIWFELCQRRGYIRYRENPRGF
jgi:hypothetical protein